MKCPECNIKIIGKQKFCKYCGAKIPAFQQDEKAVEAENEKIVIPEVVSDNTLRSAVDLVIEREMPFRKYTRIITSRTKPGAPIALININSASLEELATLPGINTIVAKRIVYMRQARNGFSSFEEFGKLMNLAPYILNQIKQKAVISDASELEQKQPQNKYSARIVDY